MVVLGVLYSGKYSRPRIQVKGIVVGTCARVFMLRACVCVCLFTSVYVFVCLSCMYYVCKLVFMFVNFIGHKFCQYN